MSSFLLIALVVSLSLTMSARRQMHDASRRLDVDRARRAESFSLGYGVAVYVILLALAATL